MHRLRYVLFVGVLGGLVSGCGGETQPNAPAAPEAVNADFAKKSADMMKSANTGMNPPSKPAAPSK